jgi:hypothetical protein
VSDPRPPPFGPRVLVLARASVVYAAGMVNEQRGASSSSERSLARVAFQFFGASSRCRSLGQYGSTRRTSSRYCCGSMECARQEAIQLWRCAL